MMNNNSRNQLLTIDFNRLNHVLGGKNDGPAHIGGKDEPRPVKLPPLRLPPHRVTGAGSAH